MNDIVIHIDIPINWNWHEITSINWICLSYYLSIVFYRGITFPVNIHLFIFLMIKLLNECKLINGYCSQMDFEMIYVAYTSFVKQSISCENSHSSFPSRHPFFDLLYLNWTRRFNGLESWTNINIVYVAKIKCRIYIMA